MSSQRHNSEVFESNQNKQEVYNSHMAAIL